MAEQRSSGSGRASKQSDGAQASEKMQRPQEAAQEAADTAEEQANPEGAVEQGQQAAGQASQLASGAQGTVREELGSIVRDAALEVLGPVARQATKQAAQYAASKGPEIAKDTLLPKIQEAGGAGALAKGALSSVSDAGGGLMSKLGGGGGGGDSEARGTGKGRRLPVQESVDVAVPVETAYNQFTQFEDYPKFMFRVQKVEQKDDGHLEWQEKIWGIRRQWEAEITEQRPNERIVWKSTSGIDTTGVVTFHRLDDRLTRVQVNHDFQPQGLMEKTASGFRHSRRALKSDLMRFKAYIEMRDEETGAWRGRVEEGEVVEEEGAEQAESRDEEPESEYVSEEEYEAQEEPEGEEEYEPEEDSEHQAEPQASEEEPEEQEPEEEEPEEEQQPRRRRSAQQSSARRRSPARTRQRSGSRK